MTTLLDHPGTRWLEIDDRPADTATDRAHIRRLAADTRREGRSVLGFPGNLAFDYRDLADLLGVLFNNLGDPDSPDRTAMSTKPFEHQVVRFLAGLANGDPDATYGYVASGCTEGNLFGLSLGRRHLPHAPVYFSAEAHDAVRKVTDLLRVEAVSIPTLPDGGMDPRALRAACTARPGRGAIVLATIGTTMRGAIDDLPAVRAAAQAAGEVFVHVDAALGGLIARFAPGKRAWGFDAGADSLTVSGHKLIGLPVPAAIVLARSVLVRPAATAEYIGATDATLSCSRSGLAALLLWAALRGLGREGLAARVRACLDIASFAEQQLDVLGLHPWRHPDSITVTFDRPSPQICQRWHLAVQGDRAHIVTVPHIRTDQIAQLCNDLARAGR